MNGIFSQSRTGAQNPNAAPFIVLNGILGSDNADVSSQILVYVRIWNRVLSANEVVLLSYGTSGTSYQLYTQPIWTARPPAASFNALTGGLATVTGGISAASSVYNVTHEDATGNIVSDATGTALFVTRTLSGNRTCDS